MELKASITQLQKITIHYLLLMDNHLVRFYKTLYSKVLFLDPDQINISDEKILSRDATRAIIPGKRNSFNVENTVTLETYPENNNETIPDYIEKNNVNYCKFLQF